MKLFIDTNVLIDLLDAEREEHENAVSFFSISKANGIGLFTTGDVLATAAYYIGDAKVFTQKMLILNSFVQLLPMSNEIIDKVNSRSHPDYEDLMHIVCAEENSMSAIITRDKKHYNERYTSIPILSESDFLSYCPN